MQTVEVIYDGRCGFCIRSLRIVRAFDLFGTLRFHDSHRPKTLAHFPALREAKTDEAMYALAEGEPLYEGFFAFRRLIWINALTWILIPLFYFPGAAFLGSRIYSWVARNRTRFGCDSDACELPTSPRT